MNDYEFETCVLEILDKQELSGVDNSTLRIMFQYMMMDLMATRRELSESLKEINDDREW